MLFFSRTQIFSVYYFRMYAALVALGGVHALLLLPVLLALAGPQELRVVRVAMTRRPSSVQPVRCAFVPQIRGAALCESAVAVVCCLMVCAMPRGCALAASVDSRSKMQMLALWVAPNVPILLTAA